MSSCLVSTLPQQPRDPHLLPVGLVVTVSRSQQDLHGSVEFVLTFQHLTRGDVFVFNCAFYFVDRI